jgi:hypothetical protein
MRDEERQRTERLVKMITDIVLPSVVLSLAVVVAVALFLPLSFFASFAFFAVQIRPSERMNADPAQ